jgi:hypothetical protein
VVGYAYLFSVLAVVLTSGYMAPYATGGRTVSMIFNLWNLAWFAVTLTAFVYVKRKRFDQHGNWMIRVLLYESLHSSALDPIIRCAWFGI